MTQRTSSGKTADVEYSETVNDGSASPPGLRRGNYALANRQLVRSREAGGQSSPQVVSTGIRTSGEMSRSAAASETGPNRFQETRIFTPTQAAVRLRRAIEAAERRRRELESGVGEDCS